MLELACSMYNPINDLQVDFINIYIDNLMRSYVLSAYPTFEEALSVDMNPSIDACPALHCKSLSQKREMLMYRILRR